METRKWLEAISKTIDSKDAAGFSGFLTEDCVFRFGNQPAVKGRQATKEYVAAFFEMIGGSEHKIEDIFEKENSYVWQGEVLYTRKDGKKVGVKFANIFHMEGELIKDYLIYIDNAPLFA